MCYLPNWLIIIWYLGSSKYEGLIKISQASVMGKNKIGSADMSQVLELWEWGIERVEPLHETVYINALHLNIHYMNENAVIPTVWKTHDKIVVWLDRRFLFQSDDLDLNKLEDWYITLKWNVNKIDEYTGGKWLW